jgi:hypothetical protein
MKAQLYDTAACPGAAEERFLDGPVMGGVLAGYLSRDDLAREFNVSPRTVTRWTFQVDGLPYLELGNRTLYERASVLAWLAARCRQAQPTKRRRTA